MPEKFSGGKIRVFFFFYFWFNGSWVIHIYILYLRVWWSLPKVIEPAEKFLWYTAIKSKVLAIRNYFCQSKLRSDQKSCTGKNPKLLSSHYHSACCLILIPCAVRYEPPGFLITFLIMLMIRSDTKYCIGLSVGLVSF